MSKGKGPLGNEGWKMSPEKIIVIAVVAFLAISIPVYALSQQAMEKCSPKCIEDGYDAVISAEFILKKECRCLNTITREEKLVPWE